jgi:hypothetical protein
MSLRPRFYLLPAIAVQAGAVRKSLPSVSDSDFPWDQGFTSWRLLGANNRELGRGSRSMPVQDVAVEVQVVLACAEQLLIVVTQTSTGNWLWRAHRYGVALAVSSRSYPRQRECHYSARKFLRALPTAVMSEGVRQAIERHCPTPGVTRPRGASETAVDAAFRSVQPNASQGAER